MDDALMCHHFVMVGRLKDTGLSQQWDDNLPVIEKALIHMASK